MRLAGTGRDQQHALMEFGGNSGVAPAASAPPRSLTAFDVRAACHVIEYAANALRAAGHVRTAEDLIEAIIPVTPENELSALAARQGYPLQEVA